MGVDKLLPHFRGVFKFLAFLVLITGFLTWSYLVHFTIRNPVRRRRIFSQSSRLCATFFLKALSVKVDVKNAPTDAQRYLLVSNHMGFIDILIICSLMPTLFVTSVEMKETPFLGTLTEMGGCIYVERRSRTKILEELSSIVEVLKQGFRVTLYPEAASTNGEQVLPFKKTLMMAAAQAGVPIQPVVVNFRRINGEDFTTKWRDHVCWYGDMPFVAAGWRTLTLKSVHAEIEYLEQVMVSPEEDRAIVAQKIHRMIAQKFTPVRQEPSDSPVPSSLGIDPT